MISQSWPGFCVLRTFHWLFDATIVSRMISWLYFLMFTLAFFLMVMHISAYSIRCLSSQLPTISRRFFIRSLVGNDILDFKGLLIALPTLDALCWIVSVMVSLNVSMLSSSCSVSKRFLNSSCNSIFGPICVVSTFGGHQCLPFGGHQCLPFHLYVQFDIASNNYVVTSNVDSCTSVTTSGLFVKM